MGPVHFVLVRPARPENIGAVARVLANADLDELRLVAPGDWRTVGAFRMAWQAEEVLENARVFDDLAAAVGDCRFVAGLSGRGRDRIAHLSPRGLAAETVRIEGPAAVVFGSEATGLTLRERALCQRQVRIPSSPRQPSLNLAQAAMVAAYEIHLARASPASGAAPPPRARAEEAERALSLLRDAMTDIGLLPPEKPEVRFAAWRDLFGRAGLTHRETRLLMALARRMAGAARAGKD